MARSLAFAGPPKPRDVLFGRGAFSNNYQGNHRYRRILRRFSGMYQRARDCEKSSIAMVAILAVLDPQEDGTFWSSRWELLGGIPIKYAPRFGNVEEAYRHSNIRFVRQIENNERSLYPANTKWLIADVHSQVVPKVGHVLRTGKPKDAPSLQAAGVFPALASPQSTAVAISNYPPGIGSHFASSSRMYEYSPVGMMPPTPPGVARMPALLSGYPNHNNASLALPNLGHENTRPPNVRSAPVQEEPDDYLADLIVTDQEKQNDADLLAFIAKNPFEDFFPE